MGKAALRHTRHTYCKWATSFDEAELDLNEGLHKLHQLVAATVSATGALSCGTGNRMENEHKCLEKAMRILDMDGYELIAVVEKKWDTMWESKMMR